MRETDTKLTDKWENPDEGVYVAGRDKHKTKLTKQIAINNNRTRRTINKMPPIYRLIDIMLPRLRCCHEEKEERKGCESISDTVKLRYSGNRGTLARRKKKERRYKHRFVCSSV